MVIAVLSLTALVIVIVLGIVKPNINIGVIAIAFAYAIGIFVLGLKEKDIPLLFPANLFLMLVGITLIFGIAYENGTLQIFTNKIVGLVKSKPQFLPIIFFLITLLISALGPGNIAATALIAPIAIATALKAKISPLLMAIMVCTGANAGAFSPISPTGIIGIGLMDKIGVNSKDLSGVVFLASALIQSVSAVLAYVVFKGFLNNHKEEIKVDEIESKNVRINRNQILTIIAIVLLIVSLSIFKALLSLASFVIVSILFVITKFEDTIKNVSLDTYLILDLNNQ
jgi:Na+/H+ antiporter NhaD/arsenite permease-like protein